MMLTKEQAAAVWCPMKKGDMLDKCSADKCAMWRWGKWDTKLVQRVEEGNFHPSRPGNPVTKRVVNDVEMVPTRGYCGLAGAPVITQG